MSCVEGGNIWYSWIFTVEVLYTLVVFIYIYIYDSIEDKRYDIAMNSERGEADMYITYTRCWGWYNENRRYLVIDVVFIYCTYPPVYQRLIWHTDLTLENMLESNKNIYPFEYTYCTYTRCIYVLYHMLGRNTSIWYVASRNILPYLKAQYEIRCRKL